MLINSVIVVKTSRLSNANNAITCYLMLVIWLSDSPKAVNFRLGARDPRLPLIRILVCSRFAHVSQKCAKREFYQVRKLLICYSLYYSSYEGNGQEEENNKTFISNYWYFILQYQSFLMIKTNIGLVNYMYIQLHHKLF